MSEIIVDISRPPFCIIRHPTEYKPEDFKELFVTLRARLDAQVRWGVFVDLRGSKPSMGGSENREAASAAILENVAFLKDMTICEARIVSAPLVRGILTVLDWVTPRPWPVRNFGNIEIAEDWVRARMAAAGVEVPAERVWAAKERASS